MEQNFYSPTFEEYINIKYIIDNVGLPENFKDIAPLLVNSVVYAEKILGKKVCEEINYRILTKNEREIFLSALIDAVEENYYHGVYLENSTNEENKLEPIATFQYKEDATKFTKMASVLGVNILTSPGETCLSVKIKSPTHVVNNEQRIKMVYELLDYDNKTSQEQDLLLNTLFDELANSEYIEKELAKKEWKKFHAWVNLKNEKNEEEYDPYEQKSLVEKFEKFKKEKEKLDDQYKDLKKRHRRLIEKPKTVWEADATKIENEATMLAIKYLDLFRKVEYFRSDYYVHTHAKINENITKGESNEYITLYGQISNFQSEIEYKTQHGLGPIGLIHNDFTGTRNIFQNKKVRKRMLDFIREKMKNHIYKEAENEENNIIIKAKNAEMSRYKGVYTGEHQSKEEKVGEYLSRKGWLLRLDLNKYPEEYHSAYESFKTNKIDLKRYLAEHDEIQMLSKYGVDKKKFEKYYASREEYSNVYSGISKGKVFFDDSNKIIVYTEKTDEGFNVVVSDLSAYMNKLAEDKGENPPNKTGATKTFLFNGKGEFTKLETVTYFKGKKIVKESKKKDWTFRSEYEFLSAKAFKTVDAEKIDAYAQALLTVVSATKSAENEKYGKFEGKVQAGNISMGTTKEKNEVTALKAELTYKDKKGKKIEAKGTIGKVDLKFDPKNPSPIKNSFSINVRGNEGSVSNKKTKTENNETKEETDFSVKTNLEEPLGQRGKWGDEAVKTAQNVYKDYKKSEKTFPEFFAEKVEKIKDRINKVEEIVIKTKNTLEKIAENSRRLTEK